MAIDFPNSPANNDIFSSNGKTWEYDGTAWAIKAAATSIATGSITYDKLATDSVTTVKIADGAITAAKIADGTIVAAEIAADAVTTAKILDANVTAAKLASGVAVSNIGYTPANIASPSFTGTPTLPTGTIATTQTAADSTTAVATTAFVTTADNLKANIASPTFTGTVAGISSTMVSALPLEITLNAQTGTTYTFVLADSSKFVTCSNASAVVATVPPNSSVAFPTGTQINIMMLGAGSTSIAAGAGVTIRSDGSKLTLNAQYAVATLLKIDTNTWVAVGNLKA